MKTNQGTSPHSRQGWIIVATVFLNFAMLYGAWYSCSVFLVALLREFGWSRSLVAGSFSVFSLIHGSLSAIMGWMANRVSPKQLLLVGTCLVGSGLLLAGETTEWWHLYVAFGVVTAAGISMAGWVPSVLIVRGWFPDRVGTAIGVASAGIGIGMSGVVPLTQLLIDWFGWRWAYRILGAAIAGWVLPATLWLIRDPPIDGSDAAAGARARRQPAEAGVYWTIASAVRDRRYWALAGVFFCGNFVTQMLLVHQVAYMVDRGVPVMIAAFVGGGVVGVASIVGKIGWGALSDRIGRELAYTLGLSCVVASIGALVLVGMYPVSVFPYLYGVLIGVGYAATAPLTPAAASDLFGGAGFSTIFGTLQGMMSLGAAVSSWGAGKIFDVTGSYAVALWVALGSAILAPIFMWLAAPRRPHPPPGGKPSATSDQLSNLR